MNLVANLLTADNVAADLDVGSKKRLFEHVGQLFENHHHGLSRGLVFDALSARERLGSTGLGLGVAIPHGRIKGLNQAAGAFIRLAKPIDFDAPDGQPVSLVFVMLAPEAANEEHLLALSELAEMFSLRTFREKLIAAPDTASLHAAFTQWLAPVALAA